MSGLLGTNFGRAGASILSDELKKLAVWNKGLEIPGQDKSVYRRDAYGHVIKYSEHGNCSSEHGWEFDHFPIPKSHGGSDAVFNLRPLHWRANRALSNKGGLLGL